jgi:hypothetical protein
MFFLNYHCIIGIAMAACIGVSFHGAAQFVLLQREDTIRVEKHYDNRGPLTRMDSAYFSIPNSVFVSLDEGFNDSVHVTVNDHRIIDRSLKTNESIGLAAGFAISFRDTSEVKIIQIRFIKQNKIIVEKLDLRYKSLQVRGLRPWGFYYGNRFYMRQ